MIFPFPFGGICDRSLEGSPNFNAYGIAFSWIFFQELLGGDAKKHIFCTKCLSKLPKQSNVQLNPPSTYEHALP